MPKDQRFIRYYMPLEADLNQAWHGHLNSKLGTEEDSGNASPLDVSSSKVPLPMFGHFDVVCPWDPDVPALDTNSFSPQLGYVRLQTSRLSMREGAKPETALFRSPPSRKIRNDPAFLTQDDSHKDLKPSRDPRRIQSARPAGGRRPGSVGEAVCANMAPPQPTDESTVDSPLWHKYTSADFNQTADIQELASWVVKLRPRSVHDLKPILILLQGILTRVLKGKFQFFSSEAMGLKSAAAKMQAQYEASLRDLEVKMEELEKEMEEKERKLTFRSIFEKSIVQIKLLKEEHGLEKAQQSLQGLLAERAERERESATVITQLKADVVRLQDTITVKDQRLFTLQARVDELEGIFKSNASEVESLRDRTKKAEAELARQRDAVRAMQKPLFISLADKVQLEKDCAATLEGLETPEQLRAWAMRAGSVGVGVALGGVPPERGACVLGTLEPANAAQALEHMMPTQAARVLALFIKDHQQTNAPKAVVRRLPPSFLGALAAELKDADLSNLHKAYSLTKEVSAAQMCCIKASKMLGETAPHSDHEAAAAALLGNLHPRTAALLLAQAKACKAARVVPLLPMGVAGDIFQGLHALFSCWLSAKPMAQGMDSVEKKLTLKGDALRDCKSMEELQEEAQALAQEIQDRFRVRVAVTCLPEEAEQPPLSPRDPESDQTPASPSGGGANEESLPPGGLEDYHETASTTMGFELMEGMTILARSGGEVAPTSEEEERACEAHPVVAGDKTLAQLQEQACASGEIVRSRKLVILPVMLGPKKCAGAVLAFGARCPQCLRALAGGSRHEGDPLLDHPHLTPVLQSMVTGIAESMKGLEAQEEQDIREVEAMLEEPGKEFPKAKSKAERQKFNRILNVVAMRQARVIGKDAILKQLREVKSYSRPPPQVVKIMLAVFQILREPSLNAVIKMPAKSLPISEAQLSALWHTITKHIELSPYRSTFLVKRMQDAVNGHISTDLSLATRVMFEATEALMEGVTHEEAVKGSHVVGTIRKWVLSMTGQHKICLQKV